MKRSAITITATFLLILGTALGLRAADQSTVAPEPRAKANAAVERDHAKLLAAAREQIKQHAQDGKSGRLETAWTGLATVLSSPQDTDETKEAVKLAVQIIPRLRLDIVKQWLVSCMSENSTRGLAITDAIGEWIGKSGSSLDSYPDRRAKLLKLQLAALEAYVAKAPKPLNEEPQKLITRLATTWMEEADNSRRMQNAYPPQPQPGRPIQPRPVPQPMPQQSYTGNAIAIHDFLDASPSSQFIAALPDAKMQTRLLESMVRVSLAAGDEEGAFTRIESLASGKSSATPQLVNEFVQAWVRSHNPNPNMNNPNMIPQQIVYNASGQPVRIAMPLTRSLQERNLDDLARWVGRFRKLAAYQPEESLLIQAFISCHTANSIFTRQALQTVFGPPRELKPESLGRLVDHLRVNVNMLHMQLSQQRSVRKPEDLQADLLAGYAMIRSLLDDSLAKEPSNWKLATSRAAVMFDELDFEHGIQPKPDFTSRRTEIMNEFSRAAGLYAAQVDDRTESHPDLTVYEKWFLSSLGSSELVNLTEEKQQDSRQPARIRAAMLNLPGEAGERHLAEFAASLYPRINMVKPAMKPRYLRMGADVVGDHPRLGEAKRLLAYYKDLSKELKLSVVLDGPPSVGTMEPFGVFVLLRHTKEIEQGSGGFGRFLQNQVGNSVVINNMGRPSANYRDRFEESMKAALEDHFQVVSCTFETDRVVSRPTEEEGWRITPYAYLVLKARSSQIDRLPSLQFDIDFIDTVGFVVLGIESPAVPIDASRRASRPAEQISVVQTVDERKASEGQLRLEIKATARGLVPEMNQLLTAIPAGFETVKSDTQGLSVLKFDPDAPRPAVQSERIWFLTLQAKPGNGDTHFRFPTALASETKTKLQRYQDAADIVPAEPEIVVGNFAVSSSNPWRYVGLALVIALFVLGPVVVLQVMRHMRTSQPESSLVAPERATPVVVLGYLRTIATHGQLTETQRSELDDTIHRIERYHFSGETSEAAPPELKAIVEHWSSTPCAAS